MLTSFSRPIFRLSVVILVNENILRATPVLSKDIKYRNFARWSSRKPSKVFTPNNDSSDSFDTEEFFKSEYTESSEEKHVTKERKQEKHSHSLEEKEVSENLQSSEDMHYTVLEENDLTFCKLMSQVGNRKMRRKNDLIMLEGKRLNIDAIQAGLKPKKLYFTQKSLLKELILPPNSNVPFYKIPYKTIALWSKLESPPGIVGFYSMVREGDIKTKDTIPVSIICDNIRDPGNMGSIIRVAASVGCTEIILLKGCTDPWDSKVLRSASGGHFHIPLKIDMLWSQHREFLNPSDLVVIADSITDRTHQVANKIPQHLYYDMNYKTPHSIAVIIGGETEGLSSDAFKLATKYNGSRVYIPLSNSVESLNSGCALSVILFEIKRQFLKEKSVPGSENWEENCLSEEENVKSVRSGV